LQYGLVHREGGSVYVAANGRTVDLPAPRNATWAVKMPPTLAEHDGTGNTAYHLMMGQVIPPTT